MNKALMKALLALLLLTLLGAAFLSINAQDRPAEYLLSADEAKAWADFDAAEQQITRALSEAVTRAINAPVGAASIEIHGAISQVGLSLELVRSRRAAWLGDLRARENCAACTIENNKLVSPKAKKD